MRLQGWVMKKKVFQGMTTQKFARQINAETKQVHCVLRAGSTSVLSIFRSSSMIMTCRETPRNTVKTRSARGNCHWPLFLATVEDITAVFTCHPTSTDATMTIRRLSVTDSQEIWRRLMVRRFARFKVRSLIWIRLSLQYLLHIFFGLRIRLKITHSIPKVADDSSSQINRIEDRGILWSFRSLMKIT